MEAKSASITPTAAAAVAAPPPALLTEEGAIVEGSVTPIELLAEATELAREALAHHAKAHQHQHQHQTHSHASNPADSPAAQHANDTAVAAPTAITTVVTPPAQIEKPQVYIHDPVPNVAGNAVAAVESKVGTTPLSTVREEQRPKDTTPPTTTTQQQKDVKTPVAQPAVAATTPPSDMAVSPAVATTPHPSYGNKRTASGAIKAPSQSLPATPYQPSSASPRNGRERIGELSTQLRSRLSYAMIKMQNGLQGQSFDQVEHYIAGKQQTRPSQSPSMATATTPLMPSATLPSNQAAAASQALKRQTSADSYGGGLGISMMPLPPLTSPRAPHSRVGRHSRTTSDPSAMFLAPAANISSYQDPNYWVKPPPSPLPSNVRGTVQGSSNAPDSFAARYHLSPGRHLAPAAPIRHHARSPGGHHTLPARRGRLPPPSLPKTFSNMSNMSTASNISTAATEVLSVLDEPSSQTLSQNSGAVRPCTPVRTNTLTMEQDAVESLMFLSSPGHSQHRGSRPASRSAVSTHQPQFQSQLIQQVWNGSNTDQEGDSFMGETAASTIVDDDEVRLVEEEEDELDRELDRERKNQEYVEPDTDQELRREANGIASSGRAVRQGRGEQGTRVKRAKTMEEVLSAAERADAAAHWQYTAATTATEKSAAAPVAPSPMLSSG